MTEAFRAEIEARAGNRCEYCRSPGYIGTHRFSVENIVPRAHGGSAEAENLALACQGCNNFKYVKTAAPDPESREEVPVFHPRRDRWNEHFVWSADLLEVVGVTPVGRATVAALPLNRDEVRRFRRVLIPEGEHPPKF